MLTVGSLLTALVFSLLNTRFLRIQSVETLWDRDDFYDPAVAEVLQKQFREKNILLIFPNLDQLKETLPDSIKRLSLTKILPQTLRFSLVTRQPVALLSKWPEELKTASAAAAAAVVNHDQLQPKSSAVPYAWVDAEGWLFNQKVSSLSALPILLLDDDAFRNPKPSLAPEFFFKFFWQYQRLSQENRLPALVVLSVDKEKEILAKLDNGSYLILPAQGELTDLLTSINLIINKYYLEGRKLKKIDLRFKNPVVEFK